jgi:hypothetical protein
MVGDLREIIASHAEPNSNNISLIEVNHTKMSSKISKMKIYEEETI